MLYFKIVITKQQLRNINYVIFWNHCQRGWWWSHAFRSKNSINDADFNFGRRFVSSCNIWRFGIWIGQKGFGCYRINGGCFDSQIYHCIFNRNAINDFWTSGKVLIFNIEHVVQVNLSYKQIVCLLTSSLLNSSWGYSKLRSFK